MNKDTLDRIVKSLLAKLDDSDYPLCYTKQGQILTMQNTVVYFGTVDDADDISSETNRLHYQG